MRIPRLWPVASIAIVLITAGCSKPESAPVTAAEVSRADAAAPKETERTACEMVTAAEMSNILGTALSAEGENGGGTTTCRYHPSTGSSPHVEMKVEWGGGAAAMTAFGILGRREPGISNPMAGLGDEASAIGPALMVRVGDDLVNLTLWGVDDRIATAKRIVSAVRPRMGSSAVAKGPGSGSADAAKAGEIVSGLLDHLASESKRSRASGADGEDGASASTARATAAPSEPALGTFSGPSVRIPLVAGLTIVAAEHEPGRGDYEPIVTIANVTNEMVSTVFSATLPEGKRIQIDRAVRREDLRQARAFLSWYVEDDPLVFPGTTAFSISAAVFNDLKTKGQSDIVRVMTDANPLTAIANLFGGAHTSSLERHPGTLRRIEPHALAFPVLLNDQPVVVPAIHARGTFEGGTIDFHVLDDADNPLLLRVSGGSNGRVVRLAFPTPAVEPIEEKLKKDSRVELHGIYFDFAKATLRPESEPVLRDIARALNHNPNWKITIEGHTDNVGGDAPNLDLSRRRADAVRQALIERHRVAAANLTTAGFGASRPNASNDTLSGRALNRRVELVRQ
jgi:outer membrane protein OmpA-like peptidoglycan-associated protein